MHLIADVPKVWLVKIFTSVFVCRVVCAQAKNVLGHLIFLGHGSGLLAFLRQQDRVDVRQDPTGRDRDRTQQLGQFLVVSDGQLDVSRYDSGLFVVSGGVPGEFENFRR